MRKLVYYVAVSIDGYIAGPDGQFDAFPIEGDHMHHLITHFADAIPTSIAAQLGINQPGTTFGAVLMGRKTWEIGQLESPYSHLEQFVFTSSRSGSAENLTFTDANPVEVVRDLKRQSGADIWLCGGGNLAAQLVDEIDRMVIKRNPVLMGDGIPLFGKSSYSPRDFSVVDNHAFESGVIVSDYVRKT